MVHRACIYPGALHNPTRDRHNGVIIESKHEDKKGHAGHDAAQSSESPSGSRSASATPSMKGKEKAMETGHMKYYRSHTVTASSYVPPRPPIMNPQYDQVALPTSATRLNSTPNWSYSHPWPDGPTPLPPYPHMPVYYTPSPHYRIDGPPPMLHPVSQMPSTSYSRSRSRNQESNTRTSGLTESSTGSERTATDHGDTSTASTPSTSGGVQVIDPSLESNEVANSDKLTEEQVRAISFEITQAAMKAVLESAKQEAEARASRTLAVSNNDGHDNKKCKDFDNMRTEISAKSNCPVPAEYQDGKADSRKKLQEIDPDAKMDNEVRKMEDEVTRIEEMSEYESHPERVRSAEQPLDNEAEPMLSPAEWLTQESLASSPSS
ncbi:hypothetical protein AX17_000705 [Amanita inopinata Kibby_2008]|nr:hypothetical protein AX17_000705 [Amanita inopinata Kibby_2008]